MWDISILYQQAWQIVKKHKMLWVFGAAVGGAGGINLRSMQNFHPDKMKDTGNALQTPATHDSVNHVLGAATSSQQTIISLLQTVPLWLYFLLGLEILLVILFAIGIAVMFKAWATGALLEGVEQGIKKEVVTIEHVSHKALTHLPALLWLQLVPFFVLSLGMMLYLVVISLLLFLSHMYVIFAPLLLVGVIGTLILWVKLLFASIWAPRLVITKNLTGPQALQLGNMLSKGRTWQMLLLGIVNVVASVFVSFAPLIVLALVVGPLFFLVNKDNLNFFIALIPIGAILGVGVLFGMAVLGGISNAFKATVWSLALKTIKQP